MKVIRIIPTAVVPKTESLFLTSRQAAGLFFLFGKELMRDLVTLSFKEKQLQKLLEPEISLLGFELIRLRFSGGTDKTLQIMAERPDGTMTVGDCTDLSHALSPILDVEDSISEKYSLEISSPGIDRPLTRLEHFEQWVGYKIKVELNQPMDGRRRFKGIIQTIQGSIVVLDTFPEIVYVQFTQIANARLVMSEKLLNRHEEERILSD